MTNYTIAKNEETVERPVVDDDDDPYGGFMYVRRESDGFRKGYKVNDPLVYSISSQFLIVAQLIVLCDVFRL
ncbi:hypothetical protein ANCCAN_08315, partial [Ancylostoma caninum]